MKHTNIRLADKAGQNLKKFISESKYKTQEKFAFAMNRDPRVVRRWIKDGIDKLSTLQEIADYLEVDFYELLK